MKIHTNHLTFRDITEAATHAQVDLVRFDQRGSRTKRWSFDVKLEGESRRKPNFGGSRGTEGGYAATWDQWGVFLGFLFRLDPQMRAPYQYEDADDFAWQTNNRFNLHDDHTPWLKPRPVADWSTPQNGRPEPLTHWPFDAHGDHLFKHTGTAYHNACVSKVTFASGAVSQCTAVKRWRPLS